MARHEIDLDHDERDARARRPNGSPCVVTTDRHDVRAAYVAVATHLPFLDRVNVARRFVADRISLRSPVSPEDLVPGEGLDPCEIPG